VGSLGLSVRARIIALVAALVVRVAESWRRLAVVYGFAAIVLPVLALLTWRQAGMYTDMETLWRATLAGNPDCWLAHNNLGNLLRNQGRIKEAMEHYHRAFQSNPNSPEVMDTLGAALADKGQMDEAIENFRKAIRSIRISPKREQPGPCPRRQGPV